MPRHPGPAPHRVGSSSRIGHAIQYRARIEPRPSAPIFTSMKSKLNPDDKKELVETWTLPYAATLGSSVRSAGIFLEVRARLPEAVRKFLKIASRSLSLRMAV